MKPYEAHLYIDGGAGPYVPVRVTGYIEEGAFAIEEVYLDDLPTAKGPQCFNIIENLSEACVEDLREGAQVQAGWDGEL
jgi:hypothetical protein